MSTYFQAACDGPWEEAKEGVVKLRDWEAQSFEDFAQWVYGNTLDDVMPSRKDTSHDFLRAFKAYAIADYLGTPRMMNAIATGLLAIIKFGTNIQTYDDMAYLYHNSTEASKLRGLAVDAYVWEAAESKMLATMVKEPRYPLLEIQQYLLDLSVGFLKRLMEPKKNPLRCGDPCRYHEHTPEEVKNYPGKCPDKESSR